MRDVIELIVNAISYYQQDYLYLFGSCDSLIMDNNKLNQIVFMFVKENGI